MTNATLTLDGVRGFAASVYPPPRNPIVEAIASGTSRLLLRLGEIRRYFAIRNTLMARSERTLEDIGISREQIPTFAWHAATGR